MSLIDWEKTNMSLRLGDIAPNFRANTTSGSINFHEWLGDNWGVLFSHPKDFTPVCTTELGCVAKLKSEFDKRHVKVIGLSIDSLESHNRWILDINQTQSTTINFPIISDESFEVSTLYDMIHPKELDKFTVRSVFVIAPDKSIRLIMTYPASTGRSFDELLRVIDSLQLTAYHSVATPANWNPGEDCVILPSIPSDEAVKKFPKGFDEITPYLRLTPQPNL